MAILYTATISGIDYGFDFLDQRIDIPATVNVLLVGNLWLAIKEAQASSVGSAFKPIASGSGLDTLGTGINTFLTLTLKDDWEVNSLKSSGKFEVSGGNLIREDQADPFRDNPLITYIAFLSQAGIATQIETGVSGVVPQDLIDFRDTLMSTVMEDSETFEQTIRLLRAAAAGESTVSGTTYTFRDAADTKARITATVDSNGQRTSVTTDGA